MKIHALLVGINDYHPKSNVSSLEGCINDVHRMEAYLKTHYKDLKPQIKILKNEQATRKNIIDNFNSRLVDNVKATDIVLFYYSGHGSYNLPATEFKKFDSRNRDETLVCYDSRLKGKYDLADKELAVLISKIQEGAEIIVMVDACHSGSITRKLAERSYKRKFSKNSDSDKPRPLETYLPEDGQYYFKQFQKDGKIKIPTARHIALSACGRLEEAIEYPAGSGLFTNQILELLNKNQNLSYASLFSIIRNKVSSEYRAQNPELDPVNGFNPNSIIFRKGTIENHRRYLVKYIDKNWIMEYGAIYGMPTNKKSINKIKVGLYKPVSKNEQIDVVDVKEVYLKEMKLDFKELDTNLKFYGEILNFPSAMNVQIKGSQLLLKQFKKYEMKFNSPFISFSSIDKNSKYILDISKTKLKIIVRESNEIVHGVNKNNFAGYKYILDILERIEEWERLLELKNENTKLDKDIDFIYIDESKSKNQELRNVEIINVYPYEGEEENLDFSIDVESIHSKKLYASLLHLDFEFGITVRSSQELMPGSNRISLFQGSIYIKKGLNETVDVFKLIVSSENFDDYKYQQDSFERGKVEILKKMNLRSVRRRKTNESDWCTKSFVVRTIRNSTEITKKGLKLKNENINFIANDKFEARLSITPLWDHTKSVTNLDTIRNLIKSSDLEVLDFQNKSRSLLSQDKSIFELTNIEEKGISADNPLEIHLQKEIAAGESIIPVTMEGGFVVPIGTMKSSNNKGTVLEISHILKNSDKRRARSLKKAFWFCLIKVVGFRDKAFKLRWVRFNTKGKWIRNSRAIAKQVDNANTIAILIHGILGDTKSMSKNLMYLKSKRHYDLILTYDYENLNESIENIANVFEQKLADIGITENHKKKVDILAHSLGGLVSRTLIEKNYRNKKVINKLIMFGTPNGGSPFGEIPSALNLYGALISFGLNFGTAIVPQILASIAFLNKIKSKSENAKFLFTTLNQMGSDSSFIKGLYNNNPPETKYYIIAADILLYDSTEDKEMFSFINKVLFKIGNYFSKDESNDIAVLTEQIYSIPEIFTPIILGPIKGTHMNYFTNEESIKLLENIIQEDQ